MDDLLWSPVPRRLRVHGTVVVGHTRLPLRVFLIASGFAVTAALSIVLGAPMTRAALLAPLCGLTLLLVEGSFAGRSTRVFIEIGVSHMLRSRHLRLQPIALVLPAEHVRDTPPRSIRWATMEGAMTVDELRSVFPTRMVRGAMLRPDGRAVGVVGGGAPQWELLPPMERAVRAAAYHQALLALDRPLHVYSVDYSLNIGMQIEYLLERQEQAEIPLHVAILGEMADRLADAAPAGALRAKQVVWAVAVGVAAGSTMANLRRPSGRGEVNRGDDILFEAVECARRLADSLAALGGFPAPRLLEPEEMAQLVYRQADPIRAQRYPLHDALLARIQRVVVAEAMV